MMARGASPQPLPLLNWPEATEAATIDGERRALLDRIAKLPRHAHRRVVLEARLRELTERQLRLEAAMEARGQ